MKATSIKQIKFNRGQVSDLLSERVDMGLQNACGTVYDNIYVNRYGQIQNAPTCRFCSFQSPKTGTTPSDLPCFIIGMFDTGEDKVFPIGINITGEKICVFASLSKSNPYRTPRMDNPTVETLTDAINPHYVKMYQFGYNIVLYGQKIKPILLNVTPHATDGWLFPQLTVKENYFDGAFDNIYIRGLNIGTPSGFTVPTSGFYKIEDQAAITTEKIVKVTRNSAGSAFTQDLVGQVILTSSGGGSLQVRSVEDGDTLYAYVLSPVSGGVGVSYIPISWSDNKSEWVFGYEKAYGDTAGLGGTPSYPDSVIYVNQRLIFGGNDYHGSLISASRIGVVNDFDPETATESDAFTTAIASKDFCRIVDFVVSNNELRIACTNGEYAMSLANLTPTGSLNGFDLRSEVGIAKDTPICDCGGLTAYVSNDKNAVYVTQFSLLKDRYQPISLTSQTQDMVDNCYNLQYLKNRPNNEGNCLVGINNDSSLFVGGIDTNAGLINISKILKHEYTVTFSPIQQATYKLIRIFAVGNALWGVLDTERYDNLSMTPQSMLVRFLFNEMFDLPCWVGTVGQYANKLVLREEEHYFYDQSRFRALYYNPTNDSYTIISSIGLTDNEDNTWTVNFDDDIDVSNIVCAGFVRQADWRSVEIGVGMATREINKNIIKLEGVIEPTQVTGQGRFAGLVLTPEQAKNFITLTRSKEVQEMDVDNLSNTSYTELADVVWRRAFDNPDRELHYGVSMVAPFLIKSITATVQYDEVS